MAEETKVTPDTEKIVPPVAGTVAAEVVKTEEAEPKTVKNAETVPLSVYLTLKDDVKELKKEIKEAKASKKDIASAGIEELSKKYPDVSEDFIRDILENASSKAQLEIEKKYTPIIQKQQLEKQQEVFDKAFDKVFKEAVEANPELPKNLDKEAIKTLALTPSYKNTPLAEIIKKLYGGIEVKGKSSAENDMRSGADRQEGNVDFAKMTPSQRSQVMADPKARQKYFDYLDTAVGR